MQQRQTLKENVSYYIHRLENKKDLKIIIYALENYRKYNLNLNARKNKEIKIKGEINDIEKGQ